MGDVIRFRRPDPAYVDEVHRLCALARMPDEAEVFVARCTPERDVLAFCFAHVFGRPHPVDAARYMRRLIGPAGSRRRALRQWLGHYSR